MPIIILNLFGAYIWDWQYIQQCVMLECSTANITHCCMYYIQQCVMLECSTVFVSSMVVHHQPHIDHVYTIINIQINTFFSGHRIGAVLSFQTFGNGVTINSLPPLNNNSVGPLNFSGVGIPYLSQHAMNFYVSKGIKYCWLVYLWMDRKFESQLKTAWLRFSSR